MGLCGGETAKKKKPKTIIIPKGVVDSKKDNTFEIPLHLVDGNSNLIVKASEGPNSFLFVEPYYHNQRNSSTNEEFSAVSRKSDPFLLEPQNVPSDITTTTLSSSPKGVSFSSTQTDFSWGTQQNVVQITQPPQPSQNFPSAGTHQEKHKFSFLTQQNQMTCPICSQTSCKYIRPYSNLLNQLTPDYSRIGQDFDDGKSSMKSVRSEIIFRPERQSKHQVDETALLNKLLDEKVDKILKPILHSLAKALPVDEEREITTKTSYGSLEYKYPRERNPRRCYSPRSSAVDESIRSKSCSSRTRRCSEFDYVDEYDPLSPKTSTSPDCCGSRKKNSVLDERFDRHKKSSSSSLCYKRASVNFEPTSGISDYKEVP